MRFHTLSSEVGSIHGVDGNTGSPPMEILVGWTYKASLGDWGSGDEKNTFVKHCEMFRIHLGHFEADTCNVCMVVYHIHRRKNKYHSKDSFGEDCYILLTEIL